jgi:hypothetical protein
MHLPAMKYIFLLLLLPFASSAQEKTDFSRYTKAWVIASDEIIDRWWKEKEVYAISKSSALSRQPGGVSVFIPDTARIAKPNGSVYILAYLVNNSGDTISIARADNTIAAPETQIFAEGAWKRFQISMGSVCANSYFSTPLPPKSYNILHIEQPEAGDTETLFRVKMVIEGKTYFSNPCAVYLNKNTIAKAGTYIRPLSF